MYWLLTIQYNFSFPSEPLYQTYRATVINKEIRRQTVCRNISKTSVDYAMDLTARRAGASSGAAVGNGPPRGSPVATPAQSTLWQDLPDVRDSRVLEQLTPEQCKYQEVRGLKGQETRGGANAWSRDHKDKSMRPGVVILETQYPVINHKLK